MKRRIVVTSLVVVMMVTSMVPVWAQDSAESSVNFDPMGVTSGSVLDDLSSAEGGEVAGIAIMWMHGYATALVGYEEIGPLNQEIFETLVAFLMYYGTQAPDSTILQAAEAFVKIQ